MKNLNCKKILITALIIIVLAFSIEILGFTKWTNNGYHDTISADSILKEGNNTSINFTLNNKYIKKIDFNYSSTQELKYQVIITEYDGYNNLKERAIDDVLNQEFSTAYTNINSRVHKLKLVFLNADFSINQINVSNEFFINWYRLFFIISLLSLIAFVILAKDIIEKKPEIAFAFICFVIGFQMIINISPDLKSWDEHIHFQRVYNQSFYSQVKISESAKNLAAMDIPNVNTYEEFSLLKNYMNKNSSINNNPDIASTERFITYGNRGYIAQSLALALARLLNLSFSLSIILSKLGNLLFYIILCYFAIKNAKVGKNIFILAALIPTSIFLSSSFSYDTTVIAGCLLAFSVFISELSEPDKKLSTKSASIFILALVWASFPKAVYIPLILLGLFFNENKFYNKKQMWIFRVGIVAIFIIIMFTFIMPALSGNLSGDLRGGDTSVTEQLKLIFSHPINYTKILMNTILKTISPYFIGKETILNYAYLGMVGDLSNNINIFSIIIIAFVAFNNNEINLSYKMKIIISVIIFATICLIWTALYLSFTPVGSSNINGVSPRYYLPLFTPFLLLFSNKRLQCNVSKLSYHRVIFLSLSLISFYSIYSMILKY